MQGTRAREVGRVDHKCDRRQRYQIYDRKEHAWVEAPPDKTAIMGADEI